MVPAARKLPRDTMFGRVLCSKMLSSDLPPPQRFRHGLTGDFAEDHSVRSSTSPMALGWVALGTKSAEATGRSRDMGRIGSGPGSAPLMPGPEHWKPTSADPDSLLELDFRWHVKDILARCSLSMSRSPRPFAVP